ncbi:MAG: hypothetical protein ACTSPV_05160 [Candidatus Hodarchaeales archaeon]
MMKKEDILKRVEKLGCLVGKADDEAFGFIIGFVTALKMVKPKWKYKIVESYIKGLFSSEEKINELKSEFKPINRRQKKSD